MTVFIAVDGRAGAGTSAIADELAKSLSLDGSVTTVRMGDLYSGWGGLAEGVRRCSEDVLEPLLKGQKAIWRAWDWVYNRPGEQRLTIPAEVIIIHGTGAGAAELRRHCQAIVWVEVSGVGSQHQPPGGGGNWPEHLWKQWLANEDAWLDDDNVPLAADVTVGGLGELTDAPAAAAHVISALLELPQLCHLLAPIAERDKEPERVLSRNLKATPDAAVLFADLFGGSDHAVWLDSSNAGMPGSGPRSRYSIMADDGGPLGRRMWHNAGRNHVVFGPGTASPVTARFNTTFFTWLNSTWKEPGTRRPAWEGRPESFECAFELGWVGYLGYGLRRECGYTPIPVQTDRDGAIADAQLIFAARAVIVDHEAGAVWLLALDCPGAGAWLDHAETFAMTEEQPHCAVPPPGQGPLFEVRDGASEYRAKIRAAKDEIALGNTYEVCLTTTLSARVGAVSDSCGSDPLGIYTRLRRRSPAAFAAFARFGPLAIASSSPERFLQITQDGLLKAEPIKGTRRRSPLASPEEDDLVRAELAANPKDRAENLMIVDLLRNDLSQFAIPGSVGVSRLFSVETYSTVHQLVSTIEARLRPAAPRAQVVAAAFPPGSMTGAPKISTMKILDALEAGPRGPYSGAFGYFSRNGAADLSVIIRTLVMSQVGRIMELTLGVGGAIVADSIPEEEHEEIRTKAFAVLNSLGAEFPG